MKTMSRPFLTAAAVLALLPGAALAQQQLTDAQREKLQEVGQRVKAADTNGDGTISRAEADAGLPRIAKRFDQLDADHDGQLTAQEMQAAMQRMRAQR